MNTNTKFTTAVVTEISVASAQTEVKLNESVLESDEARSGDDKWTKRLQDGLGAIYMFSTFDASPANTAKALAKAMHEELRLHCEQHNEELTAMVERLIEVLKNPNNTYLVPSKPTQMGANLCDEVQAPLPEGFKTVPELKDTSCPGDDTYALKRLTAIAAAEKAVPKEIHSELQSIIAGAGDGKNQVNALSLANSPDLANVYLIGRQDEVNLLMTNLKWEAHDAFSIKTKIRGVTVFHDLMPVKLRGVTIWGRLEAPDGFVDLQHGPMFFQTYDCFVAYILAKVW